MLRKITAPTLLVWGTRDAMIPFENSGDYQRALADSTLVRLEGVGHLPQEESPAASLDAVRKFLAK
jgi:pimeloyl-ACP methyl ester carboxylesterase